MAEIRTRRLLLRPFVESDYDDLYEFLSQLKDDEFEPYPGITYENGRKHLEQRARSDEFFAVELAETGKVIGNIYYGKREYDSREVGCITNRDYQRNGYALEALTAVIGYAFRTGVHRVFAMCDPLNEASWSLLEKSGMKREARLRQNMCFRMNNDGTPRWKDTYIYAVLESEWADGGNMNGGITVRKVDRDTPLARRLLEFVENCSWEDVKRHTAQILTNWEFEDWETMFAAECGGRIVGMASVMKTDYYPLPDIYPWVSSIFVTEDCRGRRISGELIDRANSYLNGLGFKKSYIPSEFTGLYEKYGYTYLRDITNYGGGVDHLFVKNI